MPLIEKAIASGASRYAAPRKRFFAGQAQIFGGCACCHNQRIASVFAHVAFEREWAALQIHAVDLVKHDLRAKAFGVLQKLRHQLGALHAIGERRVVVHFGGGHQLPALRHACDDNGLQIGARGVDGGGVACGARAENNEFVMLSHFGFSL